MDAAKYLKSQGWLGAGHTLSTGKGLSKPLLVSRKSDVLGLGKKKRNHADQWWARAFDDSLDGLEVRQGDIGADGTKGVTVKQTKKGGILEGLLAGKGSLYSMFVKGEGLVGTIGKEIMEEKTPEKWRRGERGYSRECTKEGPEKRQKAGSSRAVHEIAASKDSGLGKERRRQRREAKALDLHADSKAARKDPQLKRERRRQRRETKALALLKLGDPSAVSIPLGADHESKEGDAQPRVNPADGGLKQERQRRKKAERALNAGNLERNSKSATGEGDAAARRRERRKED
jgi:nucleolar protein TMA23